MTVRRGNPMLGEYGEREAPLEVLLGWLQMIDTYRAEHRVGPSSQDLAEAWGLGSRAAAMHRLRTLRGAGLVQWTAASVRSVIVTRKGRRLLKGTAGAA